jgi:hypothetical protein
MREGWNDISGPLVICMCCIITACATKPVSAPVVAVSCPSLKSYTPAQEAAMASALALLPPDSPLVQGFVDYGALRAADRACLGQTQQ